MARHPQNNEKVAGHVPRPFYVIGVCTRNRPEQLQRLISSIANLDIPEDFAATVAIIDNNQTPQTDPASFSLPKTWNIVVQHQPTPGLVHARNTLFDVAQDLGADWLLGIDDDEWLEPDWLKEWQRGINTIDADILVGTTTMVYPEPLHPLHPRAQFPVSAAGQRPKVLQTANYAVRRQVFDNKQGSGLRFDPYFNKSGGEDAEFLLRAMRQHKLSVSSWQNAKTSEPRGADRASLRYELWRGIRNEVNGYHIAAKHRADGLTPIWRSVPLVALRSANRNLVLGTGLVLLALARFVGRRPNAGPTLGRALHRYARLGSFPAYKMKLLEQEYGN